eukprot:jgi/Bigna1/76726/fgenesh1_pg.43_\
MGWTCKRCTFINKHYNLKCELCAGPKPHATEKKASTTWNCGACTFINKNSDTKCKVCATPRAKSGSKKEAKKPSSKPAKKPETKAKSKKKETNITNSKISTPKHWVCSMCTFHNTNMRATTCSVCGNARPNNDGGNARPQNNNAGNIKKESKSSQRSTARPGKALPSSPTKTVLSNTFSTPPDRLTQFAVTAIFGGGGLRDCCGNPKPPSGIWNTQAYVGEFCDPFIMCTELNGGPVTPSIKIFAFALERLIENHTSWLTSYGVGDVVKLRTVLGLIKDSVSLSAKGAGSSSQHNEFVAHMQKRLMNLRIGEMFLLPTGWINAGGGHAIMCIFERASGSGNRGTFDLIICNTGEGLKYHPATGAFTPKQKQRTCMRLGGLAASRILHPAGLWMWTKISKQRHEAHQCPIFYDIILPFLLGDDGKTDIVDKSAVKDKYSDWRTPQRAGTCYFKSILAAFHYLMRRHGFSFDKAKQTNFAIRKEFVIDIGCHQVAYAALKEADKSRQTGKQLEEILSIVSNIKSRTAALPVRGHGTLEPPKILDMQMRGKWSPFPGFDDFAVLSKAKRDQLRDICPGPARSAASVISRPFLEIGNGVSTAQDVIDQLKKCESMCKMEMNSLADLLQAIAAIRSLFTEALPAAEPITNKSQFWCRLKLTASQQKAILLLLRTVGKYYLSFFYSTQPCYESEAEVCIVTGLILAIYDLLCRIKASDAPLPISQEIDGFALSFATCEGDRSKGLWIDDMRFVITEPSVARARAKLCEYVHWHRESKRLKRDSGFLFDYPSAQMFAKHCSTFQFTRNMMRRMNIDDDGKLSDVENYAKNCFGTGSGVVVQKSEAFRGLRDLAILFMITQRGKSHQCKLKRWKLSEVNLNFKIGEPDCQRLKIKVTFWTFFFWHNPAKPSQCENLGLFSDIDLKNRRFQIQATGNSSRVTEDDVIHHRRMPSFDNTLSDQDSEALLTFLTVPYLRIPLVMDFFLARQRYLSLINPELDAVFSGSLFEIGSYMSAADSKALLLHGEVPVQREIGTQFGYIYTELINSPATVIGPLKKMVKNTLREMDLRRYNSSSRDIVLLLARLSGRILTFVESVVDFHPRSAGAVQQETRELEEVLFYRRGAPLKKRKTTMLGVLEAWVSQCNADDDLASHSVLSAHICVLLRARPYSAMNPDHTGAFLGHFGFLMSYYSFGGEGDLQGKRDSNATRGSSRVYVKTHALKIPEHEVFSALQGFRRKASRWLRSNGELQEVMDKVVQVIVRGSGKSFRRWRNTATNGVLGADGNVAFDLNTCTLQLNSAVINPISDEVHRDPDYIAVFGHRKLHCSLKRHTTQLRHFELVDEKNAEIILWENIFGSWYDAKNSSRRAPKIANLEKLVVGYPSVLKNGFIFKGITYTRPISQLASSERWAGAIIMPILREVYPKTAIAKIFAPITIARPDATMISFFYRDGYLEGSDPGCFKEIFVWKHKLVQVWALSENGRRFFRRQIYSSRSQVSLCDLTPLQCTKQLYPPNLEPSLDRKREWPANFRYETGFVDDEMQTRWERSLEIFRTKDGKEDFKGSPRRGRERLVSARKLQGLLPSVLVDNFLFWEDFSNAGSYSGNSSIRLYGERKTDDHTAANTGVPLGALQYSLEVVIDNNTDSATFTHRTKYAARSHVREGSLVTATSLDNPRKKMLLVSLVHRNSKDPFLARLADVLGRLEDLSYTLVWTEDTSAKQDAMVEITLIEMPRLQLSFDPEIDPDHGDAALLYSIEHSGLFVSDFRNAKIEELMDGLPASLLLENSKKELFVLVSNAEPQRPYVGSAPFSCELVIDRSDPHWLKSMPQRYFIYPVHVSRMFLMCPNLASTLYLALMKALHRNYKAAFSLIDACESDMPLSSAERCILQFWLPIATDTHPDAQACKIKLSMALLYSGEKLPWDLAFEYGSYIDKLGHVSAECRFSHVQEARIVSAVGSSVSKISLQNHINSFHKTRAEVKNKTVTVRGSSGKPGGLPWRLFELSAKKFFTKHNFKDKKASDLNNSNGQYHAKIWECVSMYRPPKDTTSGTNGTAECQKVLMDNIQAQKKNLGFFFLYDLVTGRFPLFLGGPGNDGLQEVGREMGLLLTKFLYYRHTMNGLTPFANDSRQGDKSPIPYYLILCAYRGKSAPYDWAAKIPSLLKTNTQLNNRENAPKILALYQHYERLVNKGGSLLDLYFTAILGKRAFRKPTTDSIEVSYTHVPTAELHDCKRDRIHVLPWTIDAAHVGTSKADLEALLSSPLRDVGLSSFISMVKAEDEEAKVSGELGFDISDHPEAKSHVAKSMLSRLRTDIKDYATKMNSKKRPQLAHFSRSDIARYIKNRRDPGIDKAIAMLSLLVQKVDVIRSKDLFVLPKAVDFALKLSNKVPELDAKQPGGMFSEEYAKLRLLVARISGSRPMIDLEYLMASRLSSQALLDLQKANPFISQEHHKIINNVTLSVMLRANRIGQANRTISAAIKLIRMLKGVQLGRSQALGSSPSDVEKQLNGAATKVATWLGSERTYIKPGGVFDPRFLLFEYVFNMVLWSRQVALVQSFADAKRACVSQMVMGSGKTSVVTPMLALILADRSRLVTVMCPEALLAMTRDLLRERFTHVMKKRILTLQFSRSFSIAQSEDKADKKAADFEDYPAIVADLYAKLDGARVDGGVVCTTPESVKSLMLKMIESLDFCAKCSKPRGALLTKVETNYAVAEQLSRIVALWGKGCLIMDEVDLLLHPLRSELNFPVGEKKRLDLFGPRWHLPIHLLEGIFFAKSGSLSSAALAESKHGKKLAQQISYAIQKGISEKSFQSTPHLVLLSPKYYHSTLKRLLAQWLVLWYLQNKFDGVSSSHILAYILNGPIAEMTIAAKLMRTLKPKQMQLLNLGNEWLRSFLPHVLSKINRVSYGLLFPGDIPHLGRGGDLESLGSRWKTAIPFVGKDVPSAGSEFAHPDVLIGLTILAYRYSGLRMQDIKAVVAQLKRDLLFETGPKEMRPSTVKFQSWIDKVAGKQKAGRQMPNADGDDDEAKLVPLPLLQPSDPIQMETVFTKLRKLPSVITHLLTAQVFPACMYHQTTKLSASGQELAGDILFETRLGFSGTTSSLLPLDAGQCHYEQGTDGKLINVLCDPDVMSVSFKDSGWTVKSLLRDIATAKAPGFHALIDTGALVTGMSNLEVAKYMLQVGLHGKEGVVYLDRSDRQMVLLRDADQPVPLKQCGLSTGTRFTFYDQVHTTGIDIKQALSAKAAITLGKDLTFRDYSQGAYRMRGIGKGQTLEVVVIPEVKKLMEEQLAKVKSPGGDWQTKVAAWLYVNSMALEKLQFMQLCIQNLHNIWRKKAFAELTNVVAGTRAASGDDEVRSKIIFGPIGGKGTKAFDYKSTDPLTAIKIGFRQTYVDNIGVSFHKARAIHSWNGPSYGGAEKVLWKVPEGQYVTLVEACSVKPKNANDQAYVNSVKLTTNKGETSGWLGGNSSPEDVRAFYAPEGMCLCNVSGHTVSNGLASVSFHFRKYVPETKRKRSAQRQKKATTETGFTVFTAGGSAGKNLKVFREKILFQVDKGIPEVVTLQQMIRDIGKEFRGFLATPQAARDFETIKRAAAGSANDAPNEFGAEMVTEQEAEQQQQQEAQRRQEARVSYCRDKEKQIPWKISELCKYPEALSEKEEKALPYYPLSKLALPTKKPLVFPSSLKVTENFYKRKWKTMGERKLKNVSVFFDLIPNRYKLQDIRIAPGAPSSKQQAAIDVAFKMADQDDSNRISFREAEDILKAIGYKKGSVLRKRIQLLVDIDRSGDICRNEFNTMIRERMLETAQEGRYQVVATLAEAESARFYIHHKHPVLGSQCALAIETLEGGRLDCTPNFPFKATTEYFRNKRCLKFLDGSMHMRSREAFALLQALQNNSEKSRETFFQSALACRRRDRKEYNDTPLKILFTTPDEYSLLAYRLKVARFKFALQKSGMMLIDAFRKFDTSGNGVLSAGEVMEALRYLKIDLSAADASEIVNNADTDNDGQLDYLEFAQCFAEKEEKDDAEGELEYADLAETFVTKVKRLPEPVKKAAKSKPRSRSPSPTTTEYKRRGSRQVGSKLSRRLRR